MNPRILFVEDQVDWQMLVKSSLGQGVDLTFANSGREALEKVEKKRPHLILVDVNLPDMNGIVLASQFRQKEWLRSIPILFLTGNKSKQDLISAFETGADDYIQKPFDPDELAARVMARIRHVNQGSNASNDIYVWDILVQLAERRVYDLAPSTPELISFTGSEFDLLVYFIKNENKVLSREELARNLSSKKVYGARAIDSLIASVRKKLKSSADLIESVYGVGYRLQSKRIQ